LFGCSPTAIISRHISWARPQQPSSGYKNGMHGALALPGQQIFALTKRNNSVHAAE
jgi:hypothetical protein